jgi:hypothetical protein
MEILLKATAIFVVLTIVAGLGIRFAVPGKTAEDIDDRIHFLFGSILLTNFYIFGLTSIVASIAIY